jgi:hypothetical protein
MTADDEQPDEHPEGDDTEEFEDDDQTTTETDARWTYTGSIAALVMVTTTSVVFVLYAWRGARIPAWLSASWSLSLLAAVAWTFGESALRAARESQGSDE